MGKLIEVKLNRWDGGMANDIRSKEPHKARLIQHFDAFSFPHRLLPHRSSESGQDTISRKISTFAYQSTLGLVGVGTSSNKATIFYKNDYTNNTWEVTANNQTDLPDDQVSNGFLIYYPTTGRFYLPTGTTAVGIYDPTGATAWADQTVGVWTSGTRACLHSKDDTLYISYKHSTAGARIAKNNAGSWTIPALTLGTRYTITALCEYGNYLAIACKTSDSFGDSSRVFLWDRDSSVTTLSESIDWGYGTLQFLEEYEGMLIGISYHDSAVFGSNRLGPERISIKVYNGGIATEVIGLISDTTSYPTAITGQLYGTRLQKTHNRLYFLAGIQIDGAVVNGLWSISKTQGGQLALQCEYLPNNDTAVTSMEGSYVVGTFAFIAYNNDGSLSKTIETTSFTATSVYETVKYDLDDSSLKKKLVGVSVMTKPLGAGAQVIIKYKKDDDSSWTTLLTHSTAGTVSRSAVNIESSGMALPEYNEIQFRIESTGGAEVTGLSFQSEITSRRPY